MATSTGAIFSGNSQFAADLQNVITRATAIAALPIRLLDADKTTLTDEATALTGLNDKFQALQSSIDSIETALSGSAFEADISDDSKVKVSLGSGAMEGNYTVDVVSAGAYATSMTASNWVTGTGPVRSYRLSLGGESHTLFPADNSVAGIASAINSQYGDKVHATVVNVGSSTAADYRISLKAVQLGDLDPAILTGPAAPVTLQTQKTSGSGTLATSRTAQTWDDNPALTFQLSLNGQTHDITAAGNSAESVAAAITADYGDEVTATVVNLGDEVTPDYRIALAAVKPGNAQPDILASDGVADPVSLQAQQAAGSDTRAVSETTNTWDANTGAPLTYELSIAGVKYSLSPAGNTAAAVISDINTRHGDKVQAALLDLGTPTAHDYRIRLTAVQPGDLDPELIVSERSLVTQQATGAQARYMVNNSGQEIASDTRSITIASGVTVTLLAGGAGVPVNITVTRPTSALATALTAFTDAYNATVDELDKQHGLNSGVLAGQSIVSQLSKVLSGVSTYAPSEGSVSGLAALGVDLDKTGHMKFNPFSLLAADLVNSSGVTSFLGSSGKGGFLKWAADSLKGVGDATSGLLATEQAAVQSRIEDVTNRIDETQARVDQMTERMQVRMAAIDTLISSMQQQCSYLYGMFQAMETANRQYS